MSMMLRKIKRIAVVCGKAVFFILYAVVIVCGLAICAVGAYFYYSVNKGNPDLGLVGQAICSLVEFGLEIISRISSFFGL